MKWLLVSLLAIVASIFLASLSSCRIISAANGVAMLWMASVISESSPYILSKRQWLHDYSEFLSFCQNVAIRPHSLTASCLGVGTLWLSRENSQAYLLFDFPYESNLLAAATLLEFTQGRFHRYVCDILTTFFIFETLQMNGISLQDV